MPADAHAHAPASLVTTIEQIAENAPDDGVTLGELLEQLGERAFGAGLFALALPCCIPFLYIIPQLVSLPMMALAGQMAAGRREPWMPQRFASRRIDREGLRKMAKGGRTMFGWAERFAKPRLTFLTGRSAERVVGGVFAVFCASILTPLPSTNTVPGIAVAMGSFGLMEDDGLLVLGGLILGTLWVAALAFGAIFLGTQGMSALIDALQAWLGSGG